VSRTTILIVICIIVCIVIAISIQEPPPQPGHMGRQPTRETFNDTPSPPAPARVHEKEDPFCLGGCPSGAANGDELIRHHILELDNNPSTKFADWVAYRIGYETMGSGCKRTWEEDPDLPPWYTLRPSDYVGLREALQSDRGHQAPLASLCGSNYWQEADYLSNITPQKTNLNEGPWEHLENHERDLITTGVTNSVYSITGPLYEREMPGLPRAHVSHRVPSGYWKVITIQKGDSIAAAAFIMDQDSGREDDYCGDEVAIDDVEQRAHLEFFPNLGPDARAAIKDDKAESFLLNALGC
jgi:endonuclease G